MRKLGSQRLTHLPEVTARVVPELMLCSLGRAYCPLWNMI